MSLKVGQPEIREQGDMLELSASIDGPGLPPGLPDRLSYTVKSSIGLEFSSLSDTFLVGALPLAMKLKQPLEVAGTTSVRLVGSSGQGGWV